jgi:hypothetical protein
MPAVDMPARRRSAAPSLNYAASYEALVEKSRDELVVQELSPSPLRIRKDDNVRGGFGSSTEKFSTLEGDDGDPEGWTYVMSGGNGDPLIDQEVQDEWERYTGLGGHIAVEPLAVQ